MSYDSRRKDKNNKPDVFQRLGRTHSTPYLYNNGQTWYNDQRQQPQVPIDKRLNFNRHQRADDHGYQRNNGYYPRDDNFQRNDSNYSRHTNYPDYNKIINLQKTSPSITYFPQTNHNSQNTHTVSSSPIPPTRLQDDFSFVRSQHVQKDHQPFISFVNNIPRHPYKEHMENPMMSPPAPPSNRHYSPGNRPHSPSLASETSQEDRHEDRDRLAKSIQIVAPEKEGNRKIILKHQRKRSYSSDKEDHGRHKRRNRSHSPSYSSSESSFNRRDSPMSSSDKQNVHNDSSDEENAPFLKLKPDYYAPDYRKRPLPAQFRDKKKRELRDYGPLSDTRKLALKSTLVKTTADKNDAACGKVATSAKQDPAKATQDPVSATKTPVSTEKSHDSTEKAPVPVTKATVPLAQTTVPTTKATVPVTKANVPVTKANVPSTKANAPVTKTNAPVTKADVPVTKANVSVTKASVPVTKANAPVTKADVPVTKASVPSTKASVPATKANVSATKVNAPVTKANVPATKANVPPTEANVSPTEATPARIVKATTSAVQTAVPTAEKAPAEKIVTTADKTLDESKAVIKNNASPPSFATSPVIATPVKTPERQVKVEETDSSNLLKTEGQQPLVDILKTSETVKKAAPVSQRELDIDERDDIVVDVVPPTSRKSQSPKSSTSSARVDDPMQKQPLEISEPVTPVQAPKTMDDYKLFDVSNELDFKLEKAKLTEMIENEFKALMIPLIDSDGDVQMSFQNQDVKQAVSDSSKDFRMKLSVDGKEYYENIHTGEIFFQRPV